MTAFLASLAFVVLAEMGDKTQLLAMAFACRFRWQTVMWGVLVATILNHLFAVLVGNYLTALIPLSTIQIGAALSFILFGVWTIRGDELGDEAKKDKFSPYFKTETNKVQNFFTSDGVVSVGIHRPNF